MKKNEYEVKAHKDRNGFYSVEIPKAVYENKSIKIVAKGKYKQGMIKDEVKVMVDDINRQRNRLNFK
ncbi:MAG: hypothetical protein KGI06_03875 [Candidatus Micrarchaeota archaeon]|nr:hypothetical protein [Candidatus Micrarchaeota archaeon]